MIQHVKHHDRPDYRCEACAIIAFMKRQELELKGVLAGQGLGGIVIHEHAWRPVGRSEGWLDVFR